MAKIKLAGVARTGQSLGPYAGFPLGIRKTYPGWRDSIASQQKILKEEKREEMHVLR